MVFIDWSELGCNDTLETPIKLEDISGWDLGITLPSQTELL